MFKFAQFFDMNDGNWSDGVMSNGSGKEGSAI
jgi:hypothetical protein